MATCVDAALVVFGRSSDLPEVGSRREVKEAQKAQTSNKESQDAREEKRAPRQDARKSRLLARRRTLLEGIAQRIESGDRSF